MVDLALDSRLLLNTNIDLALQELDILFNTVNTELIGYPDFGTNFEQFLWQLTPAKDQLYNYINNKIRNESLFLKDMDVNIDINIDDKEYGNKLYVVNIDLKDPNNGEEIQRIYKLK